jgi:hypothetical protein
MKIVYQALLLLLLPLASNSEEACEPCGVVADFDSSKKINETTTCADLGFDGQEVDAFECALLQIGAVTSGCCSGAVDLPLECSICGAETLTNPSFAFEVDDPETTEIVESITCAEYEAFQLLLLSTFGLTDEEIKEACQQTFGFTKGAGCQCSSPKGSPDDGSPAAHATVKIASLVFVGVTFMASFFF